MKSLLGKWVAIIASAALSLCALAGCGGGGSSVAPAGQQQGTGESLKSSLERNMNPDVPADDMNELAAGNGAFAFDLYKKLRALPDISGKNMFYSPYSISIALAMVYAGAEGDTETQMKNTLRYSLPENKLHPAFNNLDLELESRGAGAQGADDKGFRLKIANSIWGQKNYPFIPQYLDTLALNYGAGLRITDFTADPESARITINNWVEEQTEDRIKNLFPDGSINNLTRLVLANAIYFNAMWKYPFTEDAEVYEDDFTLLDGSKARTEMMSKEMFLRSVQGAGFKAVELPYDGDEISMIVILPDSGRYQEFETAIDFNIVSPIVANLYERVPQTIHLSLPKFEFESSFSLNDTLISMGMTDAFVPYTADFSGIDGTRNLFIATVLHKAFVKVNEKGTEAAAATGIGVGITGVEEKVYFTINRPFIFLIRDIETGAILFAGRVLDPTE